MCGILGVNFTLFGSATILATHFHPGLFLLLNLSTMSSVPHNEYPRFSSGNSQREDDVEI